MKAQIWAIFLVLSSLTSVLAQINEGFSGPAAFTSPFWSGNLDHFTLNSHQQLQLSAVSAGSSKLWVPYPYQKGLEIGLWLRMDFNPSNSNYTQIYIQSNPLDYRHGDALYLEIGENGNEDAIHLIEKKNGVKTILATGSIATVSKGSIPLRIKIIYSSDDKLSVLVDYTGDICFQTEIEVKHALREDLSFFGIVCEYTQTRKDKFFFDDIYIGSQRFDFKSPEVFEIYIASDSSLLLQFDEPIDPLFISPEGEINITSETKLDAIEYKKRQLELHFNEKFRDQEIIVIEIFGVMDLSANALDTTLFVLIPSTPNDKELLINEILFNPIANGSDFVEIANHSNKMLSLNKLSIGNQQNGQTKILPKNLVLKPGEFLVLAEDKQNIVSQYFSHNEKVIIEVKLPAFNNDKGNVSLMLHGQYSRILDSFDYDEKFHHTFVSKVDGVSLERISFDLPNQQDNWTSASENVGYATPGIKNSSTGFLNEKVSFKARNKILIANSNGVNSEWILDFLFDKAGYIITAWVYDESGRLIHRILDNQLSSISGEIYWDGQIESGKYAPTGLYIIYVDAFHKDGNRIQKKISMGIAR